MTILHLAIAVQPAPGILREKVFLKMTLKSLRPWSRWYQAGSLRMVVLVRIWGLDMNQDSATLSATGTRTRVARVKAEYPDQLDYSGDECYVFRKCSYYVFIQAIYFQ